MILAYIRHGQPIYNPDSLTPEGRRQAEAVSLRLSKFGLDRIFVSTSTRARQTAEPTAQKCGIEPVVMDWCNEMHAWEMGSVPRSLGNPSGPWCFGFQSQDCIRKFMDPEVLALGDRWFEHPYFKGTRFAEAVRYFDFGIDRLLESLGYVHDRETNTFTARRHNDEHVALFAHEGVGSFVLSSILDIPYPLFASHFLIGWSSLTVIAFVPNEDGTVVPQVQTLGNDSHLYKEGLSTVQQNGIGY